MKAFRIWLPKNGQNSQDQIIDVALKIIIYLTYLTDSSKLGLKT